MSGESLIDPMIAYYVAGPANDRNFATRWYSYGELVLSIEDKFVTATRKFGAKVKGQAKIVARTFLDAMIAKGGWETKTNDFGAQMHQFQTDKFHAVIAEQQANDPVIAKAKEERPEYRRKTFTELVA